jgi:hypothetical protein
VRAGGFGLGQNKPGSQTRDRRTPDGLEERRVTMTRSNRRLRPNIVNACERLPGKGCQVLCAVRYSPSGTSMTVRSQITVLALRTSLDSNGKGELSSVEPTWP